MATAAKVRMRRFENRLHGGLQTAHLSAELHAALSGTEFMPRRVAWARWFMGAVPRRLCAAAREVQERGIREDLLVERLAAGAEQPWPHKVWTKIRRSFQKAVRLELHRQMFLRPHHRVRMKLERWQLPHIPRVAADRFLNRIVELRARVPPRVSAAVLGTAWNRWCTARRFQRRESAANTCLLGCGGGAEDSIEHYSRCRILRAFHASVLDIQDDFLLPMWLGTADAARHPELHTRGAIGAYAAYTVTNAARHGLPFEGDSAARALQQAAREAAIGHTFAERVLSSVWTVRKASN